MNRAKYESLSLTALRDIAKSRSMRGISAMKKADLIEALAMLDVQEEKEQEERERAQQAENVRVEQSAGAVSALRSAQEEAQQTQQVREERLEQGSARQAQPMREEQAEQGDIRQAQPTRGEQAEQGSTRQAQQVRDGRERRNGSSANPRNAAYVTRNAVPNSSIVREGQREKREEADIEQLDSGHTAHGILEVLPEGYGFIRCENYMPGDDDVYVAPSQIRRFGLKTGDILTGNTRIKTQSEKFSALLYVTSVNGFPPDDAVSRKNFEDLTPIFPNERIRLETPGCAMAMRVVDLISPIGKGQRGMIVSPPKAGKTTLLKDVALSVQKSQPDMHLLILLIDERPEEVTDIREAIEGENVEVIYSTFDELPDHHKRVAEMVIARAKRLVEHGKDVMILLDSITRLARAYNLTVSPSGRTLSGGLDPTALYMPKRFFGAARNMREGGSLTILATALVDTGSKMDDVIYEEFKGTGNMELMLDRKLQEKRVFPAINIPASGTRRDDLLLNADERSAVEIMRKGLNGMKADDAVDNLLNMFSRTQTNKDLVRQVLRQRFI